MLLAAGATSFLVAVLLTPHLFLYYDITPKVAVLFLAAATALVYTAFRFDSFRRFLGTRSGRWYAVAAVASLLFSISAAAWSTHPQLAWNGSNWRRYGAFTESATVLAAALISAHVAGCVTRLRVVLRSICAGGRVLSIYG